MPAEKIEISEAKEEGVNFRFLVNPCELIGKDGVLDSDRPDNEAARAALECGDVAALGRAMGNVLEPVSRRMRPELDAAIRAIEESGACGARMTGSGSAVFGVYADEASCRSAAQALIKAYPTCRMIKTAPCGVVIEEV